jgi:hypothetical protein
MPFKVTVDYPVAVTMKVFFNVRSHLRGIAGAAS